MEPVIPSSPSSPVSVTVPVSNPAHPSHFAWLRIITIALEAATAIGPAVITLVDPKDAALAQGLGKIALAAEQGIPQSN